MPNELTGQKNLRSRKEPLLVVKFGGENEINLVFQPTTEIGRILESFSKKANAFPHQFYRLKLQFCGKVVRRKPSTTEGHYARRNHHQTKIGIHPSHRCTGKSNYRFGTSANCQSLRPRFGHQLLFAVGEFFGSQYLWL